MTPAPYDWADVRFQLALKLNTGSIQFLTEDKLKSYESRIDSLLQGLHQEQNPDLSDCLEMFASTGRLSDALQNVLRGIAVKSLPDDVGSITESQLSRQGRPVHLSLPTEGAFDRKLKWYIFDLTNNHNSPFPESLTKLLPSIASTVIKNLECPQHVTEAGWSTALHTIGKDVLEHVERMAPFCAPEHDEDDVSLQQILEKVKSYDEGPMSTAFVYYSALQLKRGEEVIKDFSQRKTYILTSDGSVSVRQS